MSTTTIVAASQIMDQVANLLNDPNKTDYTYAVIIPYLNLAIDELSESMEEVGSSPTSQTSAPIVVPVGMTSILPINSPLPNPKYPSDLVEIQEVGERAVGSNDQFIRMIRKEYIDFAPPGNSFIYWCWENQEIKFNPNGALTSREIQLRYLAQGTPYVFRADTNITNLAMINSSSFLTYKTAALCALFIGENESRAEVLDNQAARALERTIAISNKGRQEIVTRHRPFRAGYKARGWI